jgi:hypothetical protein
MRVGARRQFDNGKRTKRIFRASPFGAEIVDRGQRVPGDALDGRFRIDEARKRFVADSPLEEGVSCELVSENAKIPC